VTRNQTEIRPESVKENPFFSVVELQISS